jgi:hypothetical protein
VTRNRARKKAIRARMAASGEPYSVAARDLGGTAPASDAATVREVIGRANSTLAAPSARIELRLENDIVRPERPARRPPGPAGRLARRFAKVAWDRIAPGVDAAFLREAFTHQVGEGFVLPTAGRYLIDFGGYAQMCIDGERFGGASGHRLEARNRERRAPQPDDPLELLKQLQGVTDARHIGGETLRGTPCRTAAVRTGSAELTVWTDDEHIRQVQMQEHASSEYSSVTQTRTLELWDFGVPVDSLDWSRLPDFRGPIWQSRLGAEDPAPGA